MSIVNFKELNGIIIRCEPYFEPDNKVPFISIDFIDIDLKNKIKFFGNVNEMKLVVDFLNDEIDKASKRKYVL